TEREYVQAGAELVGPGGALADAEALALLAESLACAGLHDQTIEVGHIGVVRALFAELADTPREEVLELLRRGDHVAAFSRARALGMSDDALLCARRALSARGFAALDALDLPHVAALREVIALARGMLGGHWAVPNLAIIPALPYYTGVVFDALRPDLG